MNQQEKEREFGYQRHVTDRGVNDSSIRHLKQVDHNIIGSSEYNSWLAQKMNEFRSTGYSREASSSWEHAFNSNMRSVDPYNF